MIIIIIGKVTCKVVKISHTFKKFRDICTLAHQLLEFKSYICILQKFHIQKY